MENVIIGRNTEINLLTECYESNRPEFVALYGRRRVGKTFLIRQLLEKHFAFSLTGIYLGTLKEQLSNFASQLTLASGKYELVPTDWFSAFTLLRIYLESLPEGRKVVFFDELPWIDTNNSRFIKALELFWNSWGSTRNDLMLIVCGSATSWMHNKLICAKGGLHNRLTRRILLQPFNLFETECFLKSRHIEWNRYQITECYMILGGIPYYLNMLHSKMSLSQNIDSFFFGKNPELDEEYNLLYGAMFDKPESYLKVVQSLFNFPEGLDRNELLIKLKKKDGGSYSKTLADLERSGIITSYPSYGKHKKEIIYRLTDFYTIFYLKFVADKRNDDKHFWSNTLDNPAKRNWTGHAFERVCMMHTEQIKKKLGINGILTNMSTWRGSEDGQRLQIDLVIDRRDQVITLCEMKFSINDFVITEQYEKTLRNKIAAFQSETNTRKALQLIFVTTYGLKHNIYSSTVQNQIILDDLFVDSI